MEITGFITNVYGFVLCCCLFENHVSTGFDLPIIHTNDIHSHVEQMNKYSGACKDTDAAAGKCYGGIARRVTQVKELRGMYPEALLLDAGDQFQGTLWFTIYKGEAAAKFMNELNYDAMVGYL